MLRTWTIAKMSLLENSRKQVFHVLCLAMLATIAGSTLLSIFTEGVRLKILTDLCMTSILLGGGVLAIALGASGIPADVENRTIQPLLARPITRAHYVIGKFVGTMLTVSSGVIVMSVAFCGLILAYGGHVDLFFITAIGYALLEVAIVASVAVAISAFASPALAAVLTFLIYLFGTIKIGYLGGLVDRSVDGVSKTLLAGVYHALPNLECFNLKTALVHHDAVPGSYLAQVAVYGVCYAALVVTLAALCFGRKEV